MWYSTSEKAVFVEILKQCGWNPHKGPNGVGEFKNSKTDPKGRILIKLNQNEMASILNSIRHNSASTVQLLYGLSDVVKTIAQGQETADGKAALTAFQKIKDELAKMQSFSGYHSSAKGITQVFFAPYTRTGDTWDGKYTLKLMKTDKQDTTPDGRTSILIGLLPAEVRLIEEYFTMALREINVYRPPVAAEKVNNTAQKGGLSDKKDTPEKKEEPVADNPIF
jgi:hypothetical protein